MSEESPRFALPYLQAGQAQKEIDHNEALLRVDALLHAAAEDVRDAPPAAPAAGQAWIVGAGAIGDWAGRAGDLAVWSGGGWRFVAPREGMTAWLASAAVAARYRGGAWEQGVLRCDILRVGGLAVVGPRQPAIAVPTGGDVIDAAARTAIGAIIVALKTHGLIGS